MTQSPDVELLRCREAFEQWAPNTPYGQFFVAKDEYGKYTSSHTHIMWMAWQAAWSARTPSNEAPVSLSGWQPIETAPKDGTWVLIYGVVCDEGGDRKIAVAQHTNELNGGTTEWHWQFAWYDGGYYGRIDEATHWIPLPKPPTQPEE